VECIQVRAVVYTRVLEAGYTHDQLADFILVLVEVYILDLEADSTVVLVEECIPDLPVTRIEATYRRGMFSLSILRSRECGT